MKNNFRKDKKKNVFVGFFTYQEYHQMNLIFVFFLRPVVYWLFENVEVVDIENQPF
jgi:hypothetical protein